MIKRNVRCKCFSETIVFDKVGWLQERSDPVADAVDDCTLCQPVRDGKRDGLITLRTSHVRYHQITCTRCLDHHVCPSTCIQRGHP